MKKILIAISVGFLILIAMSYWISIVDTGVPVSEDDIHESTNTVLSFNKLINFDKTPIITGPSCSSTQELVVLTLKENNSKDIVALGLTGTRPFVGLPYVRIMMALLEMIALSLGCLNIRKRCL